jgi:putative exosortase-associated protein (TIGR04073 family)
MFRKPILMFVFVVVVAGLLVLGTSSKQEARAGNQIEKLGKGLVNAGLGWTDMLKKPYVRVKETGNPMWAVGGFIEGIFTGAARTGGGGIDAITFPIGGSLVKDYPLQE